MLKIRNEAKYKQVNYHDRSGVSLTLTLLASGLLQSCWIEFIRGIRPSAATKKTKSPKRSPHVGGQAAPSGAGDLPPVAAFMAALESKLGFVWDMLVLQVHSDNVHALERFRTKYGYHLAPDFDEKRHHLVGMVRKPQEKGGGVAAAKARHNLAREERRAMKKRPVEEQAPANSGRRPRRAAAVNVNYAPPPDLEVTNYDLLPNW